LKTRRGETSGHLEVPPLRAFGKLKIRFCREFPDGDREQENLVFNFPNFTMSSIFKTNDIRGLWPKELSPSVCRAIGQAVAGFLADGLVIVAYDGRKGRAEILKNFVLGLRAGGKFQIKNVGYATTPMLSFLVKTEKAVGGIIITASHNPKEYNGLKIVGKNAIPISGFEIEKKIIKNK
jgi:phosphomannomutase